MQNTVQNTTGYLSNFINHLINVLPRAIEAIIVFIIFWIVAKAIANLVHNLLGRLQFNQRVHAGTGGNFIQRAIPNPMGLLASIIYWGIFLFGISIAVTMLGIPALMEIVRGIYSYIPRVIAALIIFFIAGAAAGAIGKLIKDTMGDTPTGKVVGSAVPVIIMSIAGFMILNELQFATGIVLLTYGIILGGISLGMALAFGLGGREVAARMLGDLYDKAQANKGQVAADLKTASTRGKRKADDASDQLS